MYNVYSRKKIGFLVACVSSIVAMQFLCLDVYSQSQNKPFFDYSKKYHLGFFLGTNFATFKYDLSKIYYEQDSIKSLKIETIPGLSIGGLIDIHIGEYMDFRIIPTLSIATRKVNYKTVENKNVTRSVESSLAEIPVLFKLKSQRHQNVRMYIIAGMKYAFDLSSDQGIVEDPMDPKLKILPQNIYYEYGAGLDMYFKYFKFSPEIKFSGGLNNILIIDEKMYSKVFQRLRSNIVYFSFFIEG